MTSATRHTFILHLPIPVFINKKINIHEVVDHCNPVVDVSHILLSFSGNSEYKRNQCQDFRESSGSLHKVFCARFSPISSFN
jgi:hypothetical protein